MNDTLSCCIGEIRLRTPLVLASGTAGPETLEFLKVDDVGAAVAKTITELSREGNRPPRIVESGAGLLNSIGLQNPGVDAFLETEVPAYKRHDVPLIASVGGSTIDEYRNVTERLVDVADFLAIELNVSCPNVPLGGIRLAQDERTLRRLVQTIRERVSVPVWVKCTPAVPLEPQIWAAVDEGASAVVIGNTFPATSFDITTLTSWLPRGAGGLSGPPLKPINLELVRRARALSDIPILGCGGVMSTADVIEYIAAGADGVQVGTATLVSPDAVSLMASGLRAYLAKREKTFEELVNTVRLGSPA